MGFLKLYMEKVYPDIVAIMEALSLQEEVMDTIPSIDDYQSDESGVFVGWIAGLLEGKHVCSFGLVEIGLYAGELFDKDHVDDYARLRDMIGYESWLRLALRRL